MIEKMLRKKGVIVMTVGKSSRMWWVGASLILKEEERYSFFLRVDRFNRRSGT